MPKFKTIPWNKFFKITEDPLVHYRIIPDKTVDNKTIILSKAMHELYNTPKDRIVVDIKGVQVTYRVKEKTYFDIILEPNTARFYLSVHSKWAKFMEMKMKNLWPKCSIEQVYSEELNSFERGKCAACDIRLRKHNIFSLKTTTKDLDPLNSMLAVLNDMKPESEDKVRVSFIYDSYNRVDWQQSAEDTYKHFRKGVMPKRTVLTRQDLWQQAWKLAETMANYYIELRMLLVNAFVGFMGAGEEENEDKLEKYIQKQIEKDAEIKKIIAHGGLTTDTIRKLKACTFKTYIRIISQSSNEQSRIINLRTVANAFKDLSHDNELQTVELTDRVQKRRIDEVLKFKPTKRIDNDICSDEEISKFIQIPQITLQQRYKLDSIESREMEIPPELMTGEIKIGDAPFKTKEMAAYWPIGKNVEPLPKIVIGPMGSGKTEDTANFCVSAHKKGDAVVVFDYIKENELSATVEKHTDHISINLADQSNLFAMAYPEISPGNDSWGKLETANILARQTEFLINSTIQGDPLSERMSRYLDAASKVVYIHYGGMVGDVIRILKNHAVRHQFINKALDSGIFKPEDDEIIDLYSLDEVNKEGEVIGTREGIISGIIDRISVLNKDIYIKQMLRAPVNYEQNFLKWIEEGKTILIKLPESKFTNKQVKDTIVTYFLGRIWLAALRRSGGRVVHLVTDEIHQVPTAARLVSGVVTEGRKFGIDFYFTIHYLKQFKDLHDAIISSGCSYKLLAGIEKDNIKALEQEIAPFTVEEVLSLKPFHSLNIINYGNQYARFIAKLPKPL